MSEPEAAVAAETSAAWRAFVAAPARGVARAWLHDALGGVAGDALLEAMVRHPRFQPRLTRLLLQRYALPAPETLPAPAEEDARLLSLSPEAGAALIHYAGVICHAGAFVREIRAPRVVALKQRFGEVAFATALANRELALPADAHADDEALVRAVRRDGAACLWAWLDRQSPGLVAWLRLGLARALPADEGEDDEGGRDAPASEAVNEAVSEAIGQRGASIVRRAAAVLASAEAATIDDQGDPDDARDAPAADPAGQGDPA